VPLHALVETLATQARVAVGGRDLDSTFTCFAHRSKPSPPKCGSPLAAATSKTPLSAVSRDPSKAPPSRSHPKTSRSAFDEVLPHARVETLATQARAAVGGRDLEDAVVDGQPRPLEGATFKIASQDVALGLLVQAAHDGNGLGLCLLRLQRNALKPERT
jgi:hypothetical protein